MVPSAFLGKGLSPRLSERQPPECGHECQAPAYLPTSHSTSPALESRPRRDTGPRMSKVWVFHPARSGPECGCYRECPSPLCLLPRLLLLGEVFPTSFLPRELHAPAASFKHRAQGPRSAPPTPSVELTLYCNPEQQKLECISDVQREQEGPPMYRIHTR